MSRFLYTVVMDPDGEVHINEPEDIIIAEDRGIGVHVGHYESEEESERVENPEEELTLDDADVILDEDPEYEEEYEEDLEDPEEEYDLEDIKKIDSGFTEKQFETFWEREGDYLLQKLVYLGIDVRAKFYFLTAYSYENEIKSADNIRTHIDFGKFTSDNFVEKSSSDEINSLKGLIENIDVLNIQMENEEYLNILRGYLSNEICDSFIEVLTEKDSDNRKDIEQNLGLLRKILENILAVLAYRLNAPDECKSRNGIKVRKVIKWLLGGKKEETGTIYSYPYFTNGLIKNYLYNIYEISSDFGIHPDYYQKSENESKGYQPTSNTVNSLIFSMKEIILWFGRVLGQK